MAWLPVLLLVLAVGFGLWPFLRKDKGAVQFLAAALLLALAGYSWQGRPAQPGSPKEARSDQAAVPDDDFAILHPDLLGRFNRGARWMQMADADRRAGNPRGAAQILESGVRENPRDYALWTAYAYALVAANDNLMSPASLLAFERAAQFAPDHPAPMFFYALAISRSGEWIGAEQVWRAQLERLGTNYPLYRIAIQERLAAIEQARRTRGLVRPALPLPQDAGQGAPGAPPTALPGNAAEAAPAPPGNGAD